jgi:hypothetical protein
MLRSSMHLPTSFLLDKGVVRETLRAIAHLAAQQVIPPRQAIAYQALQSMIAQGTLYLTLETYHLVRRPYHLANAILPELHVLQPGKYLRRWRRRLMDYGFSREDALILSYASFGLDLTSNRLGVEIVVTTDRVMRARWQQHRHAIEKRFRRMTCQLKAPYRETTLPTVLTPEEVLQALLG